MGTSADGAEPRYIHHHHHHLYHDDQEWSGGAVGDCHEESLMPPCTASIGYNQ